MKKALFAVLILLFAMGYQTGTAWAVDRTIEKTFALRMGGTVAFDLDTGGDLKIVGWDKDQVGVRVDIEGKDAERAEVTFDEGSSSLQVHSDFDGKHHVHADLHWTVQVPRRCDLEIETMGGGVDIAGVEGRFSGRTMGGAVRFRDLKGTSDFETMGGSVTVEDSELNGDVSTMGGSVLMRNVKGDLKGSTMGGSVTYDNVTGRSGASGENVSHVSTLGGDIKIERSDRKLTGSTMGGDIEVGHAEAIDMKTMGGDIDIGEAPGGANVETMGGDVRINSAGDHVKAKTMGGDIEVRSVDGGAVAETMGGDVNVTMVGDPARGDRGVRLSSLGGDVTLVVPDGLSMTFDLEITYSKHHRGSHRIDSDFPVKVEETQKWENGFLGRNAHKHIYGTGEVGGGKNVIKISTIDGNITIRRGPATKA